MVLNVHETFQHMQHHRVTCSILYALYKYTCIAAPRNINGQTETCGRLIYASLPLLFRWLGRDLTAGMTHKHQQTLNMLSEFTRTFKLHRRRAKAFDSAVGLRGPALGRSIS